MGWPAAVNSAAHRRKLLRIHCRGRMGSPMAVGSTSWARAGHRPGSRSSIGLRPPPGRRLRPSGKGSGALSSRSPAETESKSMPVARETRAMPPGPTALASAPASKRRWRSVRCGDRCAHRPRIAVSWSMPDSTAARRFRFGPYSLTTPMSRFRYCAGAQHLLLELPRQGLWELVMARRLCGFVWLPMLLLDPSMAAPDGAVLRLAFDGDLHDASGHGNDAF